MSKAVDVAVDVAETSNDTNNIDFKRLMFGRYAPTKAIASFFKGIDYSEMKDYLTKDPDSICCNIIEKKTGCATYKLGSEDSNSNIRAECKQ